MIQQVRRPAPVREAPLRAQVRSVAGVPRLFIGEEPVSGNLVFLNGDIPTSQPVYDSEIAHIRAAGHHRYSTITNLRFGPVAADPFAQHAAVLDGILDQDPRAQILLRVSVSESAGTDTPAGERVTYADGRMTKMVSIASERWYREACERLTALVHAVRRHPRYAGHVFGYHLECREWMSPYFYQSPDICPANSAAFRRWLAAQYPDTQALQAAWQTGDTLETAGVPGDLPLDEPSHALLLRSGDARYRDYLRYMGDLTSARIEGLAHCVKEASRRENIVIAFYGYYFEIYHAASGHFAMSRLLESPDIDGFAGPASYMDRNAGRDAAVACSGYMTAADTVARAGKLWFMESDQRTFLNPSGRTMDVAAYPPLRSLAEIRTVHRREIGAAMVHATAMYPMDLGGYGWYDDASIWTHFVRLDRAHAAYSGARRGLSAFDVALVVDERAQTDVGCSRMSARLLARMMLAMYRTGVRFSLREMGDVLGREPSEKMLIFCNPFHLTADKAAILRDRLQRDGRTAVYLYDFGCSDAAQVRALTGMEISREDTVADHRVTMTGEGIAGLQDEGSLQTGPVSRVTDGSTAVLGRYVDGTAAFAVHEEESWRAVFCGAGGLSAHNLRTLAAACGVPVLCDSGDILVADRHLAVLNTVTAGDKTLRFHETVDVWDYFAGRWAEGVDRYRFPALGQGECRWLFYGRRTAIEAMGIPPWSHLPGTPDAQEEAQE